MLPIYAPHRCIIIRFRLTDAAAEVIRHRLKEPFEDGSDAPFLAVVTADNVTYEQVLVNSLDSVELQAFSTTPTDVAVRSRLYECVGVTEGLRRLSRVFPAGTAHVEVEERKNARLRRGEEGGRAPGQDGRGPSGRAAQRPRPRPQPRHRAAPARDG